jgi:hypothetical protein
MSGAGQIFSANCGTGANTLSLTRQLGEPPPPVVALRLAYG